jgi:hypothetical protein
VNGIGKECAEGAVERDRRPRIVNEHNVSCVRLASSRGLDGDQRFGRQLCRLDKAVITRTIDGK